MIAFLVWPIASHLLGWAATSLAWWLVLDHPFTVFHIIERIL